MSLLLKLPTEVTAQVFSHWLNIEDASKVEVSLCSGAHRSKLWSILQCSMLRCNVDAEKYTSTCLLDWILKRDVIFSHLQIHGYLGYEDHKSLIAIVTRSARSLINLQFCGCNLLNEYVFDAIMSQCKNLEWIELESCTLTQPFWDMLNASHSLVKLSLVMCDIQSADTHARCPSVQVLSIGEECGEGELELALLAACDCATTYCRSDGDVTDLTSLAPTVQSLRVYRCCALEINKFPAALTQLSITFTVLDTRHVEALLLSSCPNVTHIEFVHNKGTGLNEQQIMGIGDKFDKTLECFTIRGCRGLTEPALKHVCRKCTQLAELDIGHNNHLPASVYTTVLDDAPKLRSFHIDSMKISDTALTRIALAPLMTLSMRDGTGYTDAGLTALVEGCKYLQTIVINGDLVTSFTQILWSKLCPDLIFKDYL